MPLPKHTPTNHSSPQHFKQRVLLCLHKLSDRDTHSAAATELESIAKNLTLDSLPTFISSITNNDTSDKSPVRKQCIRLISTLSEAHGDILSPYLSKLISGIIRRLRDPNTVVRTACITAAGSISCHVTKPPFTSVVKPFVDALVTEQEFNAQAGAALCMASVINGARSRARAPDTEYLSRLLLRIERLLRSESFKAKAALLTVVLSLITFGAASRAVVVRDLLNIMTDFVVKSEDWSVRKAAAEVLEKLAVVEKNLLTEFKASCLRTFEAKKFDKVKSVRETMSKMIEAWNAIPDVVEEVSPPPESRSSKEESDMHNPPRTPHIISKRTTTRTNSLENSSRKTGPAMFCKLERKKPKDRKLDTADVNIKQRPIKHETKRALFSEISEEKMHESRCHEDRSSSRVTGSNVGLNNYSVEHETEDLSLIRNQLVQIETQQSNLYDLLEKFIGSSLNGMQSLESRVRGVESTLDEISFDLAKSTGQLSNPEPTLCCKLPGADLLSSKLWKKSEIQQFPSVKNNDLESHNLQTSGSHLRAGLIKNPLAEWTSIMSNEKPKRTRGVAKFNKKLKPEEMYVDLNVNNLPISKNQIAFDSWLGGQVRTHFPEYWIQSHEFSRKRWHEFWLHVKDAWNLDEIAEDAIMRKAKTVRTNWISKELWRWYLAKGVNPCLRFTYLDASKWDDFVAMKNTPKAKEISEKARH